MLENYRYNIYSKASFEDVNAETQRLNNMRFNKELKWDQLLQSEKLNFSYSILSVNAWYLPWENYFFLTLGILQPPLFITNYSLSTQYASIDYIVGHELTHGFDTEEGGGYHIIEKGNKIASENSLYNDVNLTTLITSYYCTRFKFF